MSSRNACRVGVSNALIVPRRSENASTCHTCTAPVQVRAASPSAWTEASAWTTISIRRRSTRSAQTPATGATNSIGNCSAAVARPSMNAEPVSRYTSQLVAIVCIQVPRIDSPWPA